jgi:hypothetical protein
MKCANASTFFLQISNTINDIDSAVTAGADSVSQSYFARYLVVYISGLYEQSIKEIVWEYSSTVGKLEIENYIANQVDKTFRNPDMDNIIGLVKKFSTSWAQKIIDLDDRYKLAVNSIVTNKNQIAHGNVSGITLNDIKDFHRDATIVIEKIDELFLGI